MAWEAGGAAELAWLESVAEPDAYGMDVGAMPDAVYVLNPLYERVDGHPIDDHMREEFSAAPLPSGYRRVTWRAYTERRNIALFGASGHPAWDCPPGARDDPLVIPPDEGRVTDELVWSTIFEHLIRHSSDGPDTRCSAFWNPFWAFDPRTDTRFPHVFSGPLGEHLALFRRENGPPLNLWPEDHSWVLLTYEDDVATQVSGSTALVDALMTSPELECIRRRDLPRFSKPAR